MSSSPSPVGNVPQAAAAAVGIGAPDAGEELVGLFTPSGWVKAGLLTLCFAALFFFFFVQQHLFSFDNGDWSHAYLVPFISIYLLWQRRKEIAAIRPKVFWPGLLPIALAVPAYAMFQVSSLSNHMAQGWAGVLCIFGLVLLTTGPRMMTLAFLPIAYLVFGITISEKIMIYVTFQLKLFASQGAWALLNVLGVSTEVFGNVINITDSNGGVHPLDVAEACSGMRMVIAFLALGVAVALVGVRHWWQRTALLVLAVPVALLMNVLRVAVLGVLTLVDPKLAQGQSHMLIGTLLLVPAFFLYMAVVWALNRAVIDEPERTGGPQGSKGSKVSKPGARTVSRPPPRRINWRTLRDPGFVTALAVMIVAAASLNAAVAFMGVHLRKLKIDPPEGRRVQAVPTETESFVRAGADQVLSEEIGKELGTANYLTRTYVRKNTPAGKRPVALELHLAYYTGMIDTVPHVQERCMTGAGWQLVGLPQSVELKLDPSNWTEDTTVPPNRLGRVFTARLDMLRSDASVDRVRLPFDPANIRALVTEFTGPHGDRLFGGYFFIANGGHVGNAEGVRELAFNLTDDYAYYLKVQISSRDVRSAEELAAQARDLLTELLPEIMRCVPDWVEVEAGRYPADNPRRNSVRP